MTDLPAPPYRHAALLHAVLRVGAANVNDRYDHRLNGFPVPCPMRDVHPLPVLDPDVAAELRRATIEVVR